MDIDNLYLTDMEAALIAAWQLEFDGTDVVKVVQGDFFSTAADALVSPANSFGIMDGGLDLAIRYELGHGIEARVQDHIVQHCYGELPVGNAVIVETGHCDWPYLVVAPTMRVPMDIRHTLNAYLAFRAVLIAVLRHNMSHPQNAIRSLVCPGLGTGVGRMSAAQCALQMKIAYEQMNRPAGIPGVAELNDVYRRLSSLS